MEVSMKQWKQICDEAFCAWLKFESDIFDAYIEFTTDSILLWFWKDGHLFNGYMLHRRIYSDCEFAKFLNYFNQYQSNEVLDNIDFQEEMKAEMEEAAEEA